MRNEYHREEQESNIEVFLIRQEARQIYVGRKTLEIVPRTWEKKARNTEAEMDGLCQPRHESHRNDTI